MSHIYIMTNGHRVGIYIYRTSVRSVSIGFLMFGISNVCDSKNKIIFVLIILNIQINIFLGLIT